MNLNLVVFVLLAVTVLGSALGVIIAPRIAHSALLLALSFVGVAGIFLQLGADFLAATQVLVYVGAVTTLIVFAIMLSDRGELRGGVSAGGRWWQGVLAAAAALAFAGTMALLYRRVPLAGPSPGARGPVGLGPTTAPLGRELFTTYAVPFEIASVVLLAALVGAIYLSTRKGGKDGFDTP